MTDTPISDKLIDRIRKLMALTVERGASETEAALASEHVQRLLAEHNLSMAAIEMTGGMNEAGGKRTKEHYSRRQVYKWQRELMQAVAKLNYCKALERYEWRGTNKVFDGYSLIGRIDNVVSTQVMFDYLLETIERLARDDVKDPSLYFTRYAHSFKEGCSDRLIGRLNEQREQIVVEQARKSREDMTRARHPGAATSNLPTVLLSDVIQNEENLNEDFRNGWEPGTTAARRREREARYEQYERERQEKRDAVRAQYPDANDELISMLVEGWSLERAQEILAERSKPAKPETEAQRRKREEREERSNQRYWERLQREHARLDMGAYRKGHKAGDGVSLNRQAEHDKKHRLGN